MEFGIFNSLYLPHHLTEKDPEHAEHNRLLDEVTWTEAADKAGFKYTWATGHRCLTGSSRLAPNYSSLACVPPATKNIRIGSAFFNVPPPVNRPARVAER